MSVCEWVRLVLTIRKITVTVGDWKGALAAAEYPLEHSLSPEVFARADAPSDKRANSMWLGSAEALQCLGLERDTEAIADQLALVLQGRHAVTGEQVRWPGSRPALDANKQPRLNRHGRRLIEAVLTTFDMTFVAPQSVSWVWSQADAKLRAEIEHTMMVAANSTLVHLTQNRPVVRGEGPAQGFAASLVLHVTARTMRGEAVPPPMLHVHCYLMGVLDAKGTLRTPSSEALHEQTAMRECGAVGRAVLAQELVKLGFQIESGTGRGSRYFEIVGVPQGLLNSDLWARAEC